MYKTAPNNYLIVVTPEFYSANNY